MYFVTQTDSKDQKFRKYAAFFIEKYPLAFGGRVTYFVGEDQKEANPEKYTKLSSVTKVTYEFEDKQHAKAFQGFEAQVGNCLRADEDEAAELLLRMLLDTSDMIAKLGTSIKQADCTIQRFYLLLMPLIAMAEETNYDSAKELTNEFMQKLLQSQHALKDKVNALVQLYNSVAPDSGLKGYAFEKLVELCASDNCLEIMVTKARSIVEDSKEWCLTADERRSLYVTVARSLDQYNDSSYAFKVMHAYLRLFKKKLSADELKLTERDARRCVILAIKAVDVINFEELLDLQAIKQLSGANEEVLNLLNLFTTTDAKGFEAQINKFAKLMKAEGLTKEELIVKKSYVQICSLSTDVTNFAYSDLAKLLNIDEDEIENWAIDAIQNKIIDAKIDQQKEEIVIKSHMLRELKKKEWQSIQVKIQTWKERFERVKTVLQAAAQHEQAVQ